jgi:antitoxin (DNA-binding transcriptional repressor) of toxin-antitoxin stability system
MKEPIQVNIGNIHAQISDLIDKVQFNQETIIIYRYGKACAKLVSVTEEEKKIKPVKYSSLNKVEFL